MNYTFDDPMVTFRFNQKPISFQFFKRVCRDYKEDIRFLRTVKSIESGIIKKLKAPKISLINGALSVSYGGHISFLFRDGKFVFNDITEITTPKLSSSKCEYYIYSLKNGVFHVEKVVLKRIFSKEEEIKGQCFFFRNGDLNDIPKVISSNDNKGIADYFIRASRLGTIYREGILDTII